MSFAFNKKTTFLFCVLLFITNKNYYFFKYFYAYGRIIKIILQILQILISLSLLKI